VAPATVSLGAGLTGAVAGRAGAVGPASKRGVVVVIATMPVGRLTNSTKVRIVLGIFTAMKQGDGVGGSSIEENLRKISTYLLVGTVI